MVKDYFDPGSLFREDKKKGKQKTGIAALFAGPTAKESEEKARGYRAELKAMKAKIELDAFKREKERITSRQRKRQIALIKKKASGAFSAIRHGFKRKKQSIYD